MKSHNWNMWSIIVNVLVVLLAVDQCFGDSRIDRSKISELRCYTCVDKSCESFDWKKSDPKNCTVDDLREESIGPVLLWNLTHIPYSPIHEQLPEFTCQKIEVYQYFPTEVKKVVLRRCALRLSVNQTCDYFYNNQDRYARNTFINSSCYLCDEDGCNNGQFNHIWMPVLFVSIISCLLLK